MRMSNFRNLRILRADITNIPYVFTFYMVCDSTDLFVVNRREFVDSGEWECHYAAHAETTCEYCGKVELHSECETFTTLVRDNYSDVLAFIKLNK